MILPCNCDIIFNLISIWRNTGILNFLLDGGMDKVLITGANGFVGRHLCQAMCRAGFSVRGTIWKADIFHADENEVEYVFLEDIGPETDWNESLKDVDMVVHLAGRAHMLRENPLDPMVRQAYDQVNTLGTIRLAQMAAAADVRKFIFLSSAGVNGKETHHRPFLETDEPRPSSIYALSKLRAEEGLRQMHNQGQFSLVIIRPPLVYGPDVPGNFLRLLRIVDLKVPLPFGRINNKRSIVGINNLVNFIMLCLREPAGSGETFLVSDGEDLSTPELIRRIAAFSGRRQYLLPIPYRILQMIANALGKKEVLEKLCNSFQIDIEKAKNLLKWSPPFSVDEELEQTVKWYKDRYKHN